jgi:lipase chaperone LimK
MDKRKIIAAVGIGVIAVIVINLLLGRKGDEGYVIDPDRDIKLKDVENFHKNYEFDDNEIRDYFSTGVINNYTLLFFMSMDERFKDSKNLEEHMEKAREYLYSVMSPEEAERLLLVYRTYMNYQVTLADRTARWGNPTTPEEAIAFLHKLQEYRREVFGREAADALFGVSVKAQEYPIRRNMIVGDKDLYGAEKDKRLGELNRDMWAEEAEAVEAYREPYARYQEKLQIYEKDLAEMRSEEDRQEKIREFREELFTPEQVARLDEVDRIIAADRKKEETYRAREERVKSDPNLDADERAEKIRELQDEIFGEEADALRRRLAIEKGLEDVKR